jgi:hypothetical protein
MTTRPLRSAAALSVLLCGCATVAVEPEPGAPSGAPSPGSITVRPGRAGYVVAAPHGTSDIHTAEIAAVLAERTGFGAVIATGFVLEPDEATRPGRRYQVNRPTEGYPGRSGTAAEVATDGARHVYAEYERRVREAAGGPLRLYVEIHGNGRHESADRVEIATVGVSPEDAWRLRTLLELMRDARLRSQAGAPRLAVLIEPVDAVRYAASGAKQIGILRTPSQALHIELPRAARAEWRDLYTAVLAEFLVEAARVLEGDAAASRPTGP